MAELKIKDEQKDSIKEEIKVFENFTVDYKLNTLKDDETRADDTVYLNDLATPVHIKVQAFAIQTYGFNSYADTVQMAADALGYTIVNNG